jgi:hypothetical protein
MTPIAVRVDDEMLEQIDALCGPEVTRAAVVRTALRKYFAGRAK